MCLYGEANSQLHGKDKEGLGIAAENRALQGAERKDPREQRAESPAGPGTSPGKEAGCDLQGRNRCPWHLCA